MKLLTLALFSTLFFVSCDAPRDRKNTSNTLGANQSANNFNYTGVTNTGGVSTVVGSNGTASNVPAQFSFCASQFGGSYQFAPSNSSFVTGPYNICKSSTNQVLFQSQRSTLSRVCMIPINNAPVNGANLSVYIGSAQCAVLGAGGLNLFPLSINRPSFETFPMSGVMIISETMYNFGNPIYGTMTGTEAFFTCMNAKAQYNDDTYCNAFRSTVNYIVHFF